MLREQLNWWREIGRFGNVFDGRRWTQAVLWVAPVAFPLAAIQVVRLGVHCIRRNWPSPVEWVLALWFLGSLAALFAIAHARGRFSLVLLPPAFALAGLEIDAWQRGLKARSRAATMMAVFIFFAITHLGWHVKWARNLTHELRDGTEQMAQLLGPNDVVVGRWAPVLSFGTDAESFYVKHHFNTDRKGLAALGVTHLLGGPTEATWGIVERKFPGVLQNARQVGVVKWRGSDLPLFELDFPLGSRGEDPDGGGSH